MVIETRVDEILRLTEKFPTHDMGHNMGFKKLTICPEFKINKKIYRFMSFKRFSDLINDKMLFFAQASKLSDTFEGGHLIPGLEEECIKNRDLTFVSCWTTNSPFEESSLFMWRPNCDNENHIAIGISIETFLLDIYFSSLFQDTKFEKYIGKIEYVLPDKEDYPEKYKTNSFVPFFLKRDYFMVENEIRIIIQDMVSEDSFFSFNKYKLLDNKILNGDPVKGIPVPIDLHKIDEFIISPVADPNIVKEIKLCISNAGLNKSNLNQLPKPSDKALKKVINKVERLDKSNYKSLNSFKESKKVSRQEYESQVMEKDPSGNIRASKKIVQQCQSMKRDTNIKLNRKTG